MKRKSIERIDLTTNMVISLCSLKQLPMEILQEYRESPTTFAKLLDTNEAQIEIGKEVYKGQDFHFVKNLLIIVPWVIKHFDDETGIIQKTVLKAYPESKKYKSGMKFSEFIKKCKKIFLRENNCFYIILTIYALCAERSNSPIDLRADNDLDRGLITHILQIQNALDNDESEYNALEQLEVPEYISMLIKETIIGSDDIYKAIHRFKNDRFGFSVCELLVNYVPTEFIHDTKLTSYDRKNLAGALALYDKAANQKSIESYMEGYHENSPGFISEEDADTDEKLAFRYHAISGMLIASTLCLKLAKRLNETRNAAIEQMKENMRQDVKIENAMEKGRKEGEAKINDLHKKLSEMQERLNRMQMEADRLKLRNNDLESDMETFAEFVKALQEKNERLSHKSTGSPTEPTRKQYEKGTILVGGHPNWQRKFLEKNPSVKAFSGVDKKFDTKVLNNASLLLLNVGYMSHATFAKAINPARLKGIKIEYID